MATRTPKKATAAKRGRPARGRRRAPPDETRWDRPPPDLARDLDPRRRIETTLAGLERDFATALDAEKLPSRWEPVEWPRGVPGSWRYLKGAEPLDPRAGMSFGYVEQLVKGGPWPPPAKAAAAGLGAIEAARRGLAAGDAHGAALHAMRAVALSIHADTGLGHLEELAALGELVSNARKTGAVRGGKKRSADYRERDRQWVEKAVQLKRDHPAWSAASVAHHMISKGEASGVSAGRLAKILRRDLSRTT